MSSVTGFLAAGLFIDGFAGGGGASTGIAQAIGRDVDIAINHSPTAIAIHEANHPGTEHFCQDIRAIWPKAATRLRPVAGAWFSPDCKEYSKAKGAPVKDRHIRALANEVTNWLKEVRPTVAYLENVEEFEYAAPLDAEGVPIAHLKGQAFQRLVRQWRGLGYRVQWRLLKACDFGTPTSRRRLYIVMRCDDQPIVWPKPTHGAPNNPAVISGKLLPYRTAAECIDWSIPCPSIFDRKRELKPATMRRIAHGVMRYVVNAKKPFVIGTAFTNTRASRVFDPADPLRTTTAQNEFGVVDATLAPHITSFHGGSIGSPMDKEAPTVTANGNPTRQAGATPLGMVGATLIGVGGRRGQSAPMPLSGTYPTTTAKADAAIAVAHLEKFSENSRGKSAEEPLDTTMAGAARHAVIETTLAPFVTYGQQGGLNRSAEDPHHTIAASTKDTNCIAAAALTPLQNGERRPGEKPREQDTAEPFSTLATGGKFAQVSAFLSTFNGSDEKNGGGEAGDPLKTARAGGQHHAVVCAHIEQANGGPRNKNLAGTDARRPLSTTMASGSQQRVVETTMIEEGALPPEMMERATMVAAFLVKYYATGGESEAAQSQAADRPMDVITGKARFAVVTVTIDAVTYVIVDIGLRMLKPRELARAQGFPDDYILDPECWYVTDKGNRKFGRLPVSYQISAIGNSVCPPMARALVAANQPGLVEMRRAA